MRLRERAFMPEVEARHGGAPLSAEGIRMTRTPSCQADMSIVALKSEAYPLSPQVPLPSLPTAFSRRAALFGAVTATGFLGTAGAAAMGKGYARHTPSTLAPADARLVALCDKLHDNKAEGDDLCGAYPGVDCDSVPGWFELEGKRSVLLYQITETPAVTMAGIAAKARVLQVDTVRQDYEWLDVLSASIAEDILRIQGGARG